MRLVEGVLRSRLALETPLMKNATDLYWLAYLLTGREEISIDIVADTAASDPEEKPFFAGWMEAWARRIVIAKALAAIREELTESRRRMEHARADRSPLPRNWSLSPNASKAQIEKALLSIDVFPRAAVILSVFERVHLPDAATLLDADANLVCKPQAIGLRQFAANLAGRDERPAAGFFPSPALA